MPKRPKGEQRPADVIGNAIKAPREKSAAAVELGRAGGRKRAESMSPERRVEIARKAAQKRWKRAR